MKVSTRHKERRYDGEGYSFRNKSGEWYMIRCHECGKENYAPSVATGVCACCWRS